MAESKNRTGSQKTPLTAGSAAKPYYYHKYTIKSTHVIIDDKTRGIIIK